MGESVISISTDVRATVIDDGLRYGIKINGTGCPQLPPQLDHSTRSIYVIDSIMSGSGRSPQRDLYPQVLWPLLAELRVNHEYIKLEDATASTRLWQRFSDKPLTLIFLSGDTTLSEFVNSLSESESSGREVAILPVPLGTGNAYAHSLGIHTAADAVRALFSGRMSSFNLYRARFSPGSRLVNGHSVSELVFFVVASWGLHASLVADSDSPELRQYGLDRFKMAFQELMKENPAFNCEFSVSNGSEVCHHSSDSLSYFVIAAVPNFEEKFCISPSSDPRKSTLYVVSFDHQKDTEVSMKIMGEAYNNGAHVKNPLVRYLGVEAPKTITLRVLEEDERLCRVCIDGTIVVLAGDKELRVHSIGSSVNGWQISHISL